jgi:hypothetical protein
MNSDQTIHAVRIPDNNTPKQSSLAGSFILGAFGTLLKWAAFPVFILSVIAFFVDSPPATLYLILGVALVVGGSYCDYVSRHSMRISS